MNTHIGYIIGMVSKCGYPDRMVTSKVYSDGAQHRGSVASAGVHRDSCFTDADRLVSTSSDSSSDWRIVRMLQQVNRQCTQFGEGTIIDCKMWEEIHCELEKIGLGPGVVPQAPVSSDLKTLTSLIENVYRIIQQYITD